MASDFAIAQFRFLTPLLLVHGRLSYKRITRMIQFFFYKNLLFGVTIFVYNAFALFRCGGARAGAAPARCPCAGCLHAHACSRTRLPTPRSCPPHGRLAAASPSTTTFT